MKLKNKRFLVIGGAGFIGSHTVEYLIKNDVKEVIVFDNFFRGKKENLISSLNSKKVKVLAHGGDILQNDILENSLIGIDGVFHFAALWLLQCHEYPESAFKTNVEGTFNVINSCRKKKIKKIVFSSSASVYGDALEEPMPETHPFNSKNFYGSTKIAGEAMLNAFHYRYNLNYVGLRYMNVYGPRQDYSGAYVAVIMKMLDSIDKNEYVTIFGSGKESFDFVSVKDCARANILAMESEIKQGFYNIGTGKKTSLIKLANTLYNILGKKKKIRFKKNTNSTLVKNRIGCVKKAALDLKYVSKFDLEKGLKELILWRENHKKKNEE